jgi:O-methyltransferase
MLEPPKLAGMSEAEALPDGSARARLDQQLGQLAAQLQSLAEAVGVVQRQIVDARAATEARLNVIDANLVSLAAQCEEARRQRQQQALLDAPQLLAKELYLDLIEDALTGSLTADGALTAAGVEPYDAARRAVGFDWPATAETMIGRARMRNLRVLLERALADRVPGDFIETGVWRGGACIYARAILAAHGETERRVFLADSFRGLPPPDPASYPADAGDTHWKYPQLVVGRAEVEANFRRYRLLDERVIFLEGWFKDTLPQAPIDRLCLLRLDGDMYESTKQALDTLYCKVSPGGFVIVDDFILPACRAAVMEFRAHEKITLPMQDVDGAAVWWRVPA